MLVTQVAASWTLVSTSLKVESGELVCEVANWIDKLCGVVSLLCKRILFFIGFLPSTIDKHDQRADITFLIRKRKMNWEIMNELQLVYWTYVLGATAVKKWVGLVRAEREYKRRCSRWLVTNSTQRSHHWTCETICWGRSPIIAGHSQMCHRSVPAIFHDKLKMNKVVSKMVLKVLTAEQKRNFVLTAEIFLNYLNTSPMLLEWIIAGD